MIQDFKFAVRRLLKAPGFTASALIVLALGIGVNTAVFDLVHTLLFAPPAFSKPSELVQVFSQDKKNPKSYRGFSYPAYRDIREQNGVFTDAMGFDVALIGLGQKGDTRRTLASTVSSNYFSVLGVPLARGRSFTPEEETPGRPSPVAIVSYEYWAKARSRSGRARFAVADPRSSFYGRRHRAARFHGHVSFFHRSVDAAECLRSGSERLRA